MADEAPIRPVAPALPSRDVVKKQPTRRRPPEAERKPRKPPPKGDGKGIIDTYA